MFFHVQEWWGFRLYSYKEVVGKYWALKVWAIWEFGKCWIRQYFLEIIAWFTRLNCFRPRPPLLLDWQFCSQLTKWSFLVPTSWPHQKALVIASNFLHTTSGTLKHENVYKGMAWSTDDIKMVLLAWDNNSAFHLWSFFLDPINDVFKINNFSTSKFVINP